MLEIIKPLETICCPNIGNSECYFVTIENMVTKRARVVSLGKLFRNCPSTHLFKIISANLREKL